MTRWRYALHDLGSRAQLVHHIPWAIDSYDRMLSEAGALQQASIKLTDPRVQAMGLREQVLPRRTTLVLVRDEQVVWEGIIWTRRYRKSEGRMVIGAAELRSYFDKHRVLRPTGGPSGADKVLSFHQVDQFAIFRALLADAQTSIVRNGQMPGDIGIEMDDTQMSGVLRDREDVGDEKGAYRGTNFAYYGQLLDDLAGVENGFEWRIDSFFDSDRQLRRRLILGYPQIGRPADLDSLTLESPGLITDFEIQEDGESSADYVAAVGSNVGTTDAVRWGEAWGDAELDSGYPLLETTTSYSTVQQQTTIDEHAAADLEAFTGDLTIPSVDVHGYPLVAPGDYVRLKIRDVGWFGDQPYEEYVRVIGQRPTPGPAEKTTLLLQQGRPRQTLPRDERSALRRYAALERRVGSLEAAR